MKVTKALNRTVSDTHHPRLCTWTPCQEPTGGGKRVLSHLELSGLNVYCYDPAAVSFFHLRSYLLFVDLLTTLSEFFLAVTRPSNSHDVIPFSDFDLLPRLISAAGLRPQLSPYRSCSAGLRLSYLSNNRGGDRVRGGLSFRGERFAKRGSHTRGAALRGAVEHLSVSVLIPERAGFRQFIVSFGQSVGPWLADIGIRDIDYYDRYLQSLVSLQAVSKLLS